MRTIKIEEDVYDYLLRNTEQIEESASEILRRLLGIPAQGDKIIGKAGYDKTEISECLNDPDFQAKPTAVKKFLFILSYIYKRDRDKFKEVLKVSGKKRKYFALSSKELEEAGSNVSPKQIPGSPFWVVTNNDTTKKTEMLVSVLTRLEYSDLAVMQVVNALRKYV